MKLIVITLPRFFEGETEALTALFRAGLETLHLRKPGSTEEETRRLLDSLPAGFLAHIVLHDHFPLAAAYGLGGVHLNSRNPQPPAGHRGTVSRSCHSLQEVEASKARCSYLFLSPIYDSISKEGYASAYPPEVLRAACQSGVIGRKVMALGGVCRNRLPEIAQWGFGGAALLGDIWQRDVKDFIPHFLELKQMADRIP